MGQWLSELSRAALSKTGCNLVTVRPLAVGLGICMAVQSPGVRLGLTCGEPLGAGRVCVLRGHTQGHKLPTRHKAASLRPARKTGRQKERARGRLQGLRGPKEGKHPHTHGLEWEEEGPLDPVSHHNCQHRPAPPPLWRRRRREEVHPGPRALGL